MIKLIRKLLILNFLLFFSIPVLAFTSSTFLISQSAFKNHDYKAAIFNFRNSENKLTSDKLLDKVISAVITEDIGLAEKIASKILSEDAENQEAYIVKLVYLYSQEKYKEIKKIHGDFKDKNE